MFAIQVGEKFENLMEYLYDTYNGPTKEEVYIEPEVLHKEGNTEIMRIKVVDRDQQVLGEKQFTLTRDAMGWFEII